MLTSVALKQKKNLEMLIRLDVLTKERLHVPVDSAFRHDLSPISRLERSCGCENAWCPHRQPMTMRPFPALSFSREFGSASFHPTYINRE